MDNIFDTTPAESGSGGSGGLTISPLFVPSMEVLKEKTRLSGIPDDEGADRILEQATMRVRREFFNRLGGTIISEILDYPRTGTPTTLNERKRSLAEDIEIAWVRYYLLRDLPVHFLDGSSSIQQSWNEEGLSRRLTLREMQSLRSNLLAFCVEGIYELAHGKFDGSSIRADSIGPTVRPQLPGSSISMGVI